MVDSAKSEDKNRERTANPTDPENWSEKEALRKYRKAVQDFPFLLKQCKKFQQGVQVFKRTIKKNPSDKKSIQAVCDALEEVRVRAGLIKDKTEETLMWKFAFG